MTQTLPTIRVSNGMMFPAGYPHSACVRLHLKGGSRAGQGVKRRDYPGVYFRVVRLPPSVFVLTKRHALLSRSRRSPRRIRDNRTSTTG